MKEPLRFLGLAGWLVLTIGAGAIGAVASVNAGAFYTELARPQWAPPPTVFGPVWTVLYLLMGVAAWLVWLDGGFRKHRVALTLFLVQLAINAVWSWIFFVWTSGLWAFVDILALLGLLIATISTFINARPIAGILLIPYLIWVAFAMGLTWTVWRLNPGTLG